MQEDTTPEAAEDAASDTKPTETAEATATEAAPKSPEVVGDPVGDAPAAEPAKANAPTSDTPSDTPSGESEGLDPQLIALCVVLWLVAMGIFGFKWGDMRLDWYLGNVKEALDTGGGLPQADIEALLTFDHDKLVTKVQAEMQNPQQSDQRYRGALVRLLERVPGEKAFKVLKTCAEDGDSRVRANAYLALAARGQKTESEREESFQAILGRVRNEAEPNARGWACRALGDFKDARAAWQLLLILAHADGHSLAPLRLQALDALRKVSGKTEEQIPFDIAAPRDQRDDQIVKWESWYTGENKGEIPAGLDVKAYRKKTTDEFWTSREPNDKTKTPWLLWDLLQSIDRKATVPAETLNKLVELTKDDIMIAWTLQLPLRSRSGKRWLPVRTALGAALRKVLAAKDGELPYDPGADEEKHYEQLEALEKAFVAKGGKIPPNSSLKNHRAAEAAARKVAADNKKALDKAGAEKANQGSPGGS